MIFKMYNCDFGITYKSVSYDFEHVENVSIEDPEQTRLTRGANVKNKIGLVYTEGSKDPKRVTLTLLGVSAAINALLTTIYEAKDRCEFYVVDRVNGSSVLGKNAILCQQPRQLSIAESPDSMNVVLTFETFDLKEDHKE